MFTILQLFSWQVFINYYTDPLIKLLYQLPLITCHLNNCEIFYKNCCESCDSKLIEYFAIRAFVLHIMFLHRLCFYILKT